MKQSERLSEDDYLESLRHFRRLNEDKKYSDRKKEIQSFDDDRDQCYKTYFVVIPTDVSTNLTVAVYVDEKRAYFVGSNLYLVA